MSAVLGTHTHVQTHDARILEKGTGFMCDVGMCGPRNGILGTHRDNVIERSWHGTHVRFETFEDDDTMINGAILDINEETGLCNSIQAINIVYEHK